MAAEFLVVHQEGTGDELLINLDSVAFARRGSGAGAYTTVELVNGTSLSIRESYDELVQRKSRL